MLAATNVNTKNVNEYPLSIFDRLTRTAAASSKAITTGPTREEYTRTKLYQAGRARVRSPRTRASTITVASSGTRLAPIGAGVNE